MEKTYNVWEEKKYSIYEIDHDADLHAFEIVFDFKNRNGEISQTIYPQTIEDMKELIKDFNKGVSVDGMEDGLGNIITID